ncbi:MAG: hypothetical protein CMH53_09245 [Myxococcales bacterium]|nr:hypothetical protein [Myxococcales bacterium]
MPGRVTKLTAALGESVTKGQILIEQDTRTAVAQLAQAKAAVAQAKTSMSFASNQFKRTRRLAKSNIVDQARLDQARLGLDQSKAALRLAEAGQQVAQSQLDRLTTYSPLNGTVLRRATEAGEVAAPGVPLIDIGDLSVVHLVVEVPERHIATLQVGDAVQISVPALGGQGRVGKIAVVPHRADTRTRTFAVEVAMDNPKADLRVGMMAKANIVLSRADNQVVVPLDAVIDVPTANLSEVTNVVFVVKNNQATRVVVEAGAMEQGSIVINSGLTEGEQLIVVGQRRVVHGDKVKIVTPAGAVSSTKPSKASR